MPYETAGQHREWSMGVVRCSTTPSLSHVDCCIEATWHGSIPAMAKEMRGRVPVFSHHRRNQGFTFFFLHVFFFTPYPHHTSFQSCPGQGRSGIIVPNRIHAPHIPKADEFERKTKHVTTTMLKKRSPHTASL